MAALTASLWVACAWTTLGAGPVDYSYTTAYRAATEEAKPLVILVGADWCPACRGMKQSVIPQLERSGALAGVAFAIVNTDRQPELARKLCRGSSIPQLVMYHQTPQGWARGEMIGRQSVEQVTSFLRRGVEASLATAAQQAEVAGVAQRD
jgi:thioredoxin-like negative regulator of GroEL